MPHAPRRVFGVAACMGALGLITGLVISIGLGDTRDERSASLATDSSKQVPILVKFKAGADVEAAVQSAGGERLEALPEIGTQVISVPETERDRILAADAAQGSVERVTPAIKLSQAGVPDDPGYAQQWALPQIGWDE